VKLDRNIKIY